MLGCDDRLNEAADMGTLNWGARSGDVSNGRLKRVEKAKILFNLGRLASVEALDTMKSAIGVQNAYGAELEGLQPPDTALVRDAHDFADEVQGLELMRHSWRTYYWAVLLSGYAGMDVDRELLFAAAILHDVGLGRGRASEPKDCCFVIYGANRCKDHLVGQGHDRAKVRKIADAIGLHLNGYVSRRRHGTVAHLLSRGAMCDVFGFGKRRVDRASRRLIMSAYPKGDLVNELEIWPGHHLEGTRPDFLIGLNRKKTVPNESMALPRTRTESSAS